MLIESPIIRQLIFPGVLFNGGPGLQIRSAGRIAERELLVLSEQTEATMSKQDTRKKQKFILQTTA